MENEDSIPVGQEVYKLPTTNLCSLARIFKYYCGGCPLKSKKEEIKNERKQERDVETSY